VNETQKSGALERKPLTDGQRGTSRRGFFTAKGRIEPDVLFLERNSDRKDIILLLTKNYSHRQMMEKIP
jgi:hypothetical protein